MHFCKHNALVSHIMAELLHNYHISNYPSTNSPLPLTVQQLLLLVYLPILDYNIIC